MIQVGMESFVGRDVKNRLTGQTYSVSAVTITETSQMEFWIEDEEGNLTFVPASDLQFLD